ncbi:hypothetical protein STRAU_1060 [Streptomyces aurantiacus JA 4570]|uniref:Uncharacterized protein n=1 Tax=Streptomyces aurantiacus JA 4570 TaxID=1286094 RepID=S3ZSU5_9ACTN|nr:hypothetical protein STRAU_1060 [Streptomyces aurantiacus JA 4570]
MVAVSVAAALGLTAACSGGDGDGGDGRDGGESSTSQAKPKGPDGGAGDSGAGGGSGGGGSAAGGSDGSDGSGDESPAARKLTVSALAKGDLDRYDYDVLAKERSRFEVASDGAPAKPAACRPLSDMLASATPPKAEAHLGRTVTPKGRSGASPTDIEMFAYDDTGAARKALTELRAATKAKRCATFRAGTMRYSGVASLPAPDKGDEAVAYKLGSHQDDYVKRRTVVVVRDGSTLVSFAATNFYNPADVARDEEVREPGGLDVPGPDKADDEPKVAPAVIDAQLDKVK